MKEKKLRHLFFVGSGATAGLGFQTTAQLGQYIADVCNGERRAFEGLEEEYVEEVFLLLKGTSNDSHQQQFSALYSFDVLKSSVERLSYEVRNEGTTRTTVDLLNLLSISA